MVCGRVCVMVWGICFGVGVLRGVLCGNGNGVWIAASTPSPALPRCGLRPAGEGVSGCRFGLCVWSLLRGLCGVQKRQWRLDCCLYPLPDPPPLRASPCRGGSGSAGNAVRLSVWVVCLVVAPQVVCCPHPCPPPRGRGQFGGGMLSGCWFRVAGGCGFCPNRPYVCWVTRFALIQPALLFALAFIHTLERSRCM